MFTSPETLSGIADVQTVGQARAACGVMSSYLSLGYGLLPSISTSGGGEGLRAQIQSYLDQTNGYVAEVYNVQPTDAASQGNDVGFIDAGRLGFAAGQVDDVLAEATKAANVSQFDFGTALKKAVNEITSSVSDAASGVGSTIGAAATAPFKGLTSALAAFLYGARVALIIGGVVIIVYVFRKPIMSAVGKVGA
jgi:hypothetical protein